MSAVMLLPKSLGNLLLKSGRRLDRLLLAKLGDQLASFVRRGLELGGDPLAVAKLLLRAPALQLFALLYEPGPVCFGGRRGGPSAFDLCTRPAALLFEGGERLGKWARRPERQLSGALADLRRQPNSSGDVDRRGCTRSAELEPIGGRQPRRIEANACVHESAVRVRERLELLQVRGDEHHCAPGEQIFKNGDRQSRPFPRVGVRGDLVDQNE